MYWKKSIENLEALSWSDMIVAYKTGSILTLNTVIILSSYFATIVLRVLFGTASAYNLLSNIEGNLPFNAIFLNSYIIFLIIIIFTSKFYPLFDGCYELLGKDYECHDPDDEEDMLRLYWNSIVMTPYVMVAFSVIISILNITYGYSITELQSYVIMGSIYSVLLFGWIYFVSIYSCYQAGNVNYGNKKITLYILSGRQIKGNPNLKHYGLLTSPSPYIKVMAVLSALFIISFIVKITNSWYDGKAIVFIADLVVLMSLSSTTYITNMIKNNKI